MKATSYINHPTMAANNPSSTSTSTPTASGNNVTIRIEPTDEYKIQEISYDGQEKYIPPLSMSENLTQLIKKIDFNQSVDELQEEFENYKINQDNEGGGGGNVGEDGAEQEESESNVTNKAQPHHQISGGSSWPFESMRTKLRLALTELCVLNDVLIIAREKKYMMFDNVNSKPSDQREIVGLMTKKRVFQNAAQVLLDGVATLKATTYKPISDYGCTSIYNNLNDSSSSSNAMDASFTGSVEEPNFYDELKEMRQNWRLKRSGNNIIGDLSYFRPAGYMFTASSRFEVIKTTQATRGPNNQALAVKVPTDLEGRAHIQVSIIKNNDLSLLELSSSANGRCYESLREGSWQEKLESAQNVLFCKELVTHLAKEAVQHQFVIPTTVTGNQLIVALFPDVKLYITLVHKTPNTKCSREISDGMRKLQEEHKPVFEHSLHQMLREFYANMFRKLQGREIPKEAGPIAIDKQTLFEIQRQEISLEKMVNQARHLIMRQQTMEVIDSFAAKIKDPLIISHWFCLNSPQASIVRVDIVSLNNEILGRSHMLIYVGTRHLRVITRDCKNLILGYEPEELRHLLIWQSCLHQFIASDKLSKLLGWYTLILNYNVNVTRQDLPSTAFSLVICSSNCTHMIFIKSGPHFGLVVDVAQFKEPSAVINSLSSSSSNSSYRKPNDLSATSSIVGNDSIMSSPMTNGKGGVNGGSDTMIQLNKLQDLVDNFREVDWDKMHGKDFLSKLELLMAALTDIK